jgi:hypothetical protein
LDSRTNSRLEAAVPKTLQPALRFVAVQLPTLSFPCNPAGLIGNRPHYKNLPAQDTAHRPANKHIFSYHSSDHSYGRGGLASCTRLATINCISPFVTYDNTYRNLDAMLRFSSVEWKSLEFCESGNRCWVEYQSSSETLDTPMYTKLPSAGHREREYRSVGAWESCSTGGFQRIASPLHDSRIPVLSRPTTTVKVRSGSRLFGTALHMSARI